MKELDLLWSKKFIILEICRTPGVPAYPNTNPPNPPLPSALTSDTIFQTNSAKIYVPVVTLSVNNNIKFLPNIKQGFKRILFWKKYRAEKTTQPSKRQSRLYDWLKLLEYY